MRLWNRLTLKRMLSALFVMLITFMQTAQADSRYVFIHSDMLGSPMATTDENGNIISRENVSPYGDSLGKRDSTNNVAVGSPEHGPGYTGHVRDRDLGLTYMQARYYDPVIGRFMGTDPVSFLDSEDPSHFNRYAYANNNPYIYIDPDGRDTDLILASDPDTFMSDIAPDLYGVDTSTKEGTYAALDMMQEEAAYDIGGFLIGGGLGRIAGKLFGAGKKTVGRHMHPDELTKMTNTNRVQEGVGGQTRVADPANPNAYRNAPKGDVYVEFDVPANRLLTHSKGTSRIPGPNSPDARVSGRNPSDYEMPRVTNIRIP